MSRGPYKLVGADIEINRARNTTLPFMPPGSTQEIDNEETLTGDGERRKRKLLGKHRKKDGGMYEGLQEEDNVDDGEGESGGVKKVLKKLGCVRG